MDFCLEGDIANVQKTFDEGLASPFDRVMYRHENKRKSLDGSDKVKSTCEDWSLLHLSIANGHAQLCKFLIECSLGHGITSGMSWLRFTVKAFLSFDVVYCTEGIQYPLWWDRGGGIGRHLILRLILTT